MALKPKKLILNLLLATSGNVTSAELIRAGQLFNLTANNIRVTLTRLLSDNMIVQPQRGVYLIGPEAGQLVHDLANWRQRDALTVAWDGQWLAIMTGMLGRVDRTALRKRQRILQLAGFQEFERGCLLRPNNVRGGSAYLRQRLADLGLESSAVLCQISDLDSKDQARALAMWDVAALNNSYQQEHQRLQQWMKNFEKLSQDVAARESFLMGNQAIRALVFDPFLPKEMVDVKARKKYLSTVIRCDKLGQSIWSDLYLSIKY